MATKKKEPTETVTVRALEPLHEDGIRYAKHQTFETTPDRHAALGPLVEIQP